MSANAEANPGPRWLVPAVSTWPMFGAGLCGPPLGPQPPDSRDLASKVRQHFEHLVAEGFTDEQAIELCSAYQGTMIAFGRS